MKLNYKAETFSFWEQINSIIFERKLVNETAFDGIVKIYTVQTNNIVLNQLLKDKFFGEFICAVSTGVFLRMFKSKTSWPFTSLCYLDLVNLAWVKIKDTNSSWGDWKVSKIHGAACSSGFPLKKRSNMRECEF